MVLNLVHPYVLFPIQYISYHIPLLFLWSSARQLIDTFLHNTNSYSRLVPFLHQQSSGIGQLVILHNTFLLAPHSCPLFPSSSALLVTPISRHILSTDFAR